MWVSKLNIIKASKRYERLPAAISEAGRFRRPGRSETLRPVGLLEGSSIRDRLPWGRSETLRPTVFCGRLRSAGKHILLKGESHRL